MIFTPSRDLGEYPHPCPEGSTHGPLPSFVGTGVSGPWVPESWACRFRGHRGPSTLETRLLCAGVVNPLSHPLSSTPLSLVFSPLSLSFSFSFFLSVSN